MLIAILIAKREASGMTQTELAVSLGEYQSFVARLESGERRVDVIELIQLARVLNFDAAVVVREVEGIERSKEAVSGQVKERLVRDSGIDRTDVSRIERKAGNCTVAILEKLAKVIGCKMTEFFDEPNGEKSRC
jgi:transcriptional regulator with XRE-family HTH domain